MSVWLYAVIALAAGWLIGLIVIFNRLVGKRQMVRNGWADIDVQLKRRTDLIPRLVDVVKGYAAHERQLFADIVEKRNTALQAGDDPARRGESESALSAPVSRLMAVAEDYPDLKANENFLELQRTLETTEGEIQMARRYYNGSARELNIKVESFPSNLVARAFGFGSAEFFEIEFAAQRDAPDVGM